MSSPPASFTPRKEFLRDQQSARKSFSILALAGANCVRLYSFTPHTLQALRRLLEQFAPILSVREDTVQNLCEFSLDRKPWSNPKSVPTEKLLVDIIAVIYQSGYTYLSTIEYGREADDRLAMAFSRADTALPSAMRSAASLSPLPHPARNESSSTTSVDRPTVKRVPFAISFSSVTVMRIISPPLHLTPAILQACRGSWPRGVISEKKVYENSYEFKLKGYGFFQQDTFATDSLQHILSLLASLDSHSFTLLTSVSLTINRSRVKDLWIFTGPVPDETTSELHDPLLLESSRLHRFSLPAGSSDNHGSGHRKQATEPNPAIPHSPVIGNHSRAASESPQRSGATNVLRKPAPRAQVPVSVVRDSDILDEEPALRSHILSTIPADVEDTTGVGSAGGTPNIFYESSPFETRPSDLDNPVEPFVASPIPRQPSPFDSPASPLRPPSERMKTPPLLTSSNPPSPLRTPSSPASSKPATPVAELMPSPAPLLAAGVFRDSTFSANSEFSREIPITWTGPLHDNFNQEKLEAPKLGTRLPSTPAIPGGWQPTPISEKGEEVFEAQNKQDTTTPIHENENRIEAPEIINPNVDLRKSEAALVGLIKSTSPPPDIPTIQRDESSTVGTPGADGKGWVMINVQNPDPTSPQLASPSEPGAVTDGPVVESPDLQSSVQSPSVQSPADVQQPPLTHQATPEAKAIAILDAVEAKNKGRGSSKKGSSTKRFFSLGKKSSRTFDNEDTTKDGDRRPQMAPSSIPRSNLRDRLRLIGTPEAPRKEDKRRSID